MPARLRAAGIGVSVLCLLVSPPPTRAEESTATPPSAVSRTEPTVRTAAPDLRRLIERGQAQSSSFRSLIERLDHSDLVVYVRCEFPMTDTSLYNGKLSLLGAQGGRRFLLIELRCPSSEEFQIARLAHELRHAVEIADAPEITDEASMAAYYQKAGWPSIADCRSRRAFETEAARQMGEQVRQELRREPRPVPSSPN